MQKPDLNTIFITGACGFVGQYLIKLFDKRQDTRLVLNCRNKEQRPELQSEVVFTAVDLNDQSALTAIFKIYNPGIVIHLAGITRLKNGEKQPENAFQTNYNATKSLIKLAQKFFVKKFIFVSSDLSRNHQSVIGITKFLSESYIQKLAVMDTQVITLRLPNISWTPGSVHLIFENQIQNKKPITITHPNMSRRFLSADEAVEYILYAIKNGKHKDLFVINKQPLRITDLAKEMINESGQELKINYIGIRPGEKLEEEGYANDEIQHTSFKDLSLLKQKTFGFPEIKIAIDMMKNKDGFTMNTDEIIL